MCASGQVGSSPRVVVARLTSFAQLRVAYLAARARGISTRVTPRQSRLSNAPSDANTVGSAADGVDLALFQLRMPRQRVCDVTMHCTHGRTGSEPYSLS